MPKSLNTSELVEICNREGIHLTKGRGQNFLVDSNILSKISDITIINSVDHVIEVGSGIGNWTEFLAKKAKQIYAIEVDRKLFSILSQRMEGLEQVKSIHADVMKFGFLDFFQEHSNQQFVIAGNLPFQLTSDILFFWVDLFKNLAEPKPFNRACFMVQKEVARRITAQVGTKEYGRLTVMLAYYSQVNLERIVSRQCFFPVPTVDSAFISIHFGQGIRVHPEEDDLFEQVVRLAFSQRRKKLINNLSRLELDVEISNRSRLDKILDRAEVDGSLRAEALDAKDYLRIVQSVLDEMLKKPIV